MSRDLVLARVGRNSLHHCWTERGRERDWDLMLVPYQDIDAQDPAECAVSDVIPGPKWSGLRELLQRWDGWRGYDHVWMPDDDIFATHDTIDRMFRIARTLRLDLFAPALHESSFYAHFDTMVNRRFHGRRVGFVEIMMPGFSRAALERLLPTLDLSQTGWGWGLDSLWPQLLEHRGVAILDATPVIHTRPVGQMRDADLAARVRAESDAIFAQHGCRQVHATFEAFGADLAPLPLAPEELLRDLIDGYGYLIERDPRVLAWISEAQRPDSGWPAYPIEGTPGISTSWPAAP
jgi:hypothetical protein